MIKNSNLYARQEQEKRRRYLRQLTMQKGIGHLEELLRLRDSFQFKTTKLPRPIALIRLLKKHRKNRRSWKS